MGDLPSSSFTNNVGFALDCACKKRNGGRGAVLAALFEDPNAPGIVSENDIVYIYDHDIQPRIVAVCFVPLCYKHI
jgi:hypothetical protein